jgi:carboxyl-terminal processing protease
MTRERFGSWLRTGAIICACALCALAMGSAPAAQEAPPATKPAPARTIEAPPAKTADSRAAARARKNVESFDVVWKTVRDRHFDPKLGGLDWQAVHDEVRPKVEKAKSIAQARALMNEALDRLHQTHFEIIPSGLYEDLENPDEGPGVVGLECRLLDARAVVTQVEKQLAAAAAGVKPGWIIDKIGGKPVAEILKTAEVAYAKSGMAAAHMVLAVQRRLHARVGTKIGIDFLDAKDHSVHLDLTASEPIGVPATFGNLPTFYVRFTSRRVDGSVGYVSLNVFFDAVNVIKKFGEAIEANRDADGLIIDLRGNPGGMAIMSFGIGNWFVTKGGSKLGTLLTRTDKINFVLYPRPHPYTKPVAVLVDDMSMSTSEILAGGLRDLKLARVFGTRTPGAALPSVVEVLPNGDRFQFAIANYISAGGKPLEGAGVVPDVATPLSRAALLEGRDPALEAAARWIRSQKGGS